MAWPSGESKAPDPITSIYPTNVTKMPARPVRAFEFLTVRMICRSANQDVPELPRILGVDVFREQARAAVKRRPVGVVAFNRAEIWQLHFEAALVVDLVG